MTRIVQCVPNFSEGRRVEVIEEIIGSIKDVEGVTLLDALVDAAEFYLQFEGFDRSQVLENRLLE